MKQMKTRFEKNPLSKTPNEPSDDREYQQPKIQTLRKP